MSRSKLAAIGAGVLYATFPEIYVRSAYGGYMAITNFIMLSGAYYYLIASGLLREPGDPDPGPAKRRSMATTFLGAWTNQKAILIPAAAGLHASLMLLLDGGFSRLVARARKDPLFTTAVLATIGFVLGWITYALYGISVAPKDFIADHIRDHIYKRLKMSDVNLQDVQKGAWVYPSILALWLQFAKHYGWLFFGSAIVAAIATIKRIRRADGVILFWLAFGALGFSLVDWRQTKHLSKIVPPMVILTALFWASLDGRAKRALSVVLAGAVVWNVWSVAQTMRDFTYIQPLPIW
jgi:hypothetical protein